MADVGGFLVRLCANLAQCDVALHTVCALFQEPLRIFGRVY
jgi:hypothetical protein